MQEIYSFFRASAEQKGVQLECCLDNSKLYIIESDKTKLHQIFTNLISNALKFTIKGGVEFGIIDYQIDGYCTFYVKDTGIGIEPKNQSVIFERFRQVEISSTREFGGTGIGLSITKAYIELMGGRIWIESEIGVGSIFYFNLPIGSISFVPPENEIPEIASVKLNFNKKILVAEDEDFNYLYIKELFDGKSQLQLIRAHDGIEAVDLINKYKDIDLVLMDIKMPRLNGVEATRKIKVFNPDMPIIALSAFAMEGDDNIALDAGCDAYLKKPINKDELIRVLEKHL